MLRDDFSAELQKKDRFHIYRDVITVVVNSMCNQARIAREVAARRQTMNNIRTRIIPTSDLVPMRQLWGGVCGQTEKNEADLKGTRTVET